MNNTKTYISLFSSAGVGCYGFKENEFECIATNELIERRLNIQKINKKCRLESGYISGDIKQPNTKEKIYGEIKKWAEYGVKNVDVVIATPPCQGMSVVNHKKNDNDIERNSLIIESVELIKKIKPKFFVLENVPSFWKTGCSYKNGEIVPIGYMIKEQLGHDYNIHNEVINFKNYGSNSSRTRTLVIGVTKKYSDFISPIELFPDFQEPKTLYEVIGDMKSLKWGEYDKDDFYHSFRTYPKRMRNWISVLNEGECAFNNKKIKNIPHRVVDGKVVINKSINGDKYTRQIYDKVAPCIHTRNDQLASQNTIHPVDDRVFSIRELMKLMTIPDSFKWIDLNLTEINNKKLIEKQKISKKEEMNIRQSIGEAVPTAIFSQIASKISSFLNSKNLISEHEIVSEIQKHKLQSYDNLKKYILEHKNIYNKSSLSSLVEYANTKRKQNSAYYTNKCILDEIYKKLPSFNKEKLTIIEPSVGSGNFLPFIFKKYESVKNVKLIVVDIDIESLELLKVLYSKNNIPSNFEIEYVCDDFMNLNIDNVDLVVGNPPFSKLLSKDRKKYSKEIYNTKATNMAIFFIEKALKISNYVSLIMPKNLLNTPEYSLTRKLLKKYNVESIIDFGEKGFKGVLIETINILINKKSNSLYTEVKSIAKNVTINQKSNYIFDDKLPYWVIYRNLFFDKVFNNMEFDIFSVFRDRQITNFILKDKYSKNLIRVIKSRNIKDDGTSVISIDGYDSFCRVEDVRKFTVYKYKDSDNVYMTPNMTYNPRIIKKEKGYIVNGSVALLFPKEDVKLTEEQLKFISSNEYREFYKIARNYQTRSLNVDSSSCFWFGIKIKED